MPVPPCFFPGRLVGSSMCIFNFPKRDDSIFINQLKLSKKIQTGKVSLTACGILSQVVNCLLLDH